MRDDSGVIDDRVLVPRDDAPLHQLTVDEQQLLLGQLLLLLLLLLGLFGHVEVDDGEVLGEADADHAGEHALEGK